MTDAPQLPDEIMAWHHRPELWWLGSWATTRYPEEAEPYVRKALVAAKLHEAAEAIEPHSKADVKTGGVLRVAQGTIRALIDTDHQAALDAIRTTVWNDAILHAQAALAGDPVGDGKLRDRHNLLERLKKEAGHE